MKSRGLVIAAAAVGVAAVALAGVVYVLARPEADRFAECRTGVMAGGEDAIGGPLELVSETGETVTDAEIFTKPSLLYFGYTYCPDVCPLDTVRNAEAVEFLQERGFDVQPVFVSVDWGRDDAQSMDDFTANIHPDMLGLTGSEEQIRAASKAYRTYFNIRDPEDEFYLIDHSTFTYLVLPETGYLSFFRRELTGEQLADQVQCFLEKL
ncbi:SCO family protein [Tropicimonas isoalkanivorans]|uniref:Protein SCO1/2 n=1 Tax=Tropicimonas isoalkanivorans TaxID=441112 RepID=A0A1I1M9F3_9RHOB|nr:SCO family protein [Tropicimonas isoalkanivorans]SFC81686.1 protein SCO1/2 [Tropicimonas isoalkanivorans]